MPGSAVDKKSVKSYCAGKYNNAAELGTINRTWCFANTLARVKKRWQIWSGIKNEKRQPLQQKKLKRLSVAERLMSHIYVLQDNALLTQLLRRDSQDYVTVYISRQCKGELVRV